MAQVRQQNNGSRSRYAPPPVVHSSATEGRAVCAQLEQLTRRLAAANAEIRRYQTRLFACERQLAALRQENAELEAACEQAREEAAQAAARLEELMAEQECASAPETEPTEPAAVQTELEQPQPEPAEMQEPQAEAVVSQPELQPVQQAALQPPAEPEWQPRTELDHLSVELMNWFDEMMGA